MSTVKLLTLSVFPWTAGSAFAKHSGSIAVRARISIVYYISMIILALSLFSGEAMVSYDALCDDLPIE